MNARIRVCVHCVTVNSMPAQAMSKSQYMDSARCRDHKVRLYTLTCIGLTVPYHYYADVCMLCCIIVCFFCRFFHFIMILVVIKICENLYVFTYKCVLWSCTLSLQNRCMNFVFAQVSFSMAL